MMLWQSCINILLLLNCLEGAKILGIFWTHSKSHHILGSFLLRALAKRGHHVTFLSPFKDDVNISNFRQEQITGSEGFSEAMTTPPTENIPFVYLIKQALAVQRSSEAFWKNPAVQELIKTKDKYDVALISQFDNDAILGLAHHVEASTVLFSPVGAPTSNKYMGNPNLACYKSPFNLLDVDMRTFFGRLLTTTFNFLFFLEELFLINPNQQNLLNKYLPGAPPVEELMRNVSLVLLNSHFSIEEPRPHVPSMVQIGGFHTEKPKKLPGDLQEFLDSAGHGAVLLSFGTNIRMADFDKEKLSIILKGLGKIAPLKVLLKSEIEFPDAPENIFIKNWLPQTDILAHPNMKLFISHGGLGGTTEAVYHGVPIMGIPLFADQKSNIQITSEAGYGLRLNYEEITQETFDRTLEEALQNPKYTQNVKKYSSLLRNQPMKPLDLGIWWVEHIIENKGGEHLRNIGIDLSWYELYMADIMLFYLVVICLICLSLFHLMIFICNKMLQFTQSKWSKLKIS